MTTEPKRVGRPPGTTMPADQRKSEMIRVRVTQAQREKYEQLGGEEWLRRQIERGRLTAATPQ